MFVEFLLTDSCHHERSTFQSVPPSAKTSQHARSNKPLVAVQRYTSRSQGREVAPTGGVSTLSAVIQVTRTSSVRPATWSRGELHVVAHSLNCETLWHSSHDLKCDISTDHFSGSGRAIGPVCVSGQRCTFDKDISHAG